ncbi:Rho GTPase-activating protein 1 [Nymphaea thermarum]|nr:Rho GTPase-activating protein 1 [Nymphaea thermarum]
MTEVLQTHRFSSSPSSPFHSSDNGGGVGVQGHHAHLSSSNILVNSADLGQVSLEEEEEGCRDNTISFLALLVEAFRKSMVACKTEGKELCSMEIGWPTDVRHVAHVTFDRFNGFLGLPEEFEPEVPRRAPSASASVFGVSTESMQCSFDTRGNSVPTILLQMQRQLYDKGGLQAEGIFRINPENSQEEYVRDQLNKGIVPDNIDVHCLAGLIKAWFRELPEGLLDSLTPEQVMQSNAEADCVQLVRLLPSTKAALLDWAVNLMADVAQEEQHNKMNARNVAMVFAPNMTQVLDPLTALMHAVQVMNFLKMLILKTLRERQESVLQAAASSTHSGPSNENGHHGSSQHCLSTSAKGDEYQTEPETNELNNRTLVNDKDDGVGQEEKFGADVCRDTVEGCRMEKTSRCKPTNGGKLATSGSKTGTKGSLP